MLRDQFAMSAMGIIKNDCTSEEFAESAYMLADAMLKARKEGNCLSFGKQAEFIFQYFQKGSEIFVTGELQTRSWDDKNGVKRYMTEILVNSTSFTGGSKVGNQQGDHQMNQAQGMSAEHQKMMNAKFDDFNDDIPF